MNKIQIQSFINVEGLEGKETYPQIACNVCDKIIMPKEFCWLVTNINYNSKQINPSKYACSEECKEMATFQLMI